MPMPEPVGVARAAGHAGAVDGRVGAAGLAFTRVPRVATMYAIQRALPSAMATLPPPPWR